MSSISQGPEEPEEESLSLETTGSFEEVITSLDRDFTEVLPDGTKRRVRSRFRQTRIRSRKGPKARIPKWSIVLLLVFVAIVIGLIAAGPDEVWAWLKDLIPELL